MASSLTILTESFIGRHYEFTLERREADTAWMRIEIWNSSLDHRRDDPSKDDVVNLYDIRFDKVRRLIFKAKMNGSYPLITIGFNPAKDENKPFLRVLFADTFAYVADQTLDYTMEQADYDKLMQFLLEQDFPDIEASVIRNEKAVIKPGFAGPMTGSATKGR